MDVAAGVSLSCLTMAADSLVESHVKKAVKSSLQRPLEDMSKASERADKIPSVVKEELSGPIEFLERFQMNIKENFDRLIACDQRIHIHCQNRAFDEEYLDFALKPINLD